MYEPGYIVFTNCPKKRIKGKFYPKNITSTEPIFSKVNFTGEMLKD